MNVLVQGFRYFLTVVGLLPLLAAAATEPFVTAADKPFRLIRGTDVYLIGSGTMLQKGDILETDDAAVQIEIPPATIISLQPRTSLTIAALGAQPELVVLAGWVKLQAIAPGGEARAEILSPLMRVGARNGSILFHAAPGSAEVFAEHDGQAVAEVNGAVPAATEIKLNHEQYTVRAADQAVKMPPRPPKQFLGSLPLPFRERLMPLAGKVKGVPLKAGKERAAEFRDIEAWLRTPLAIRKAMVVRFKPRLKDAVFRKQLDASLGQTPDWKPILHPPPKPRPLEPRRPSDPAYR